MKVAVITDNIFLTAKFKALILQKKLSADFIFWSKSPSLRQYFEDVKQIDLKKDWSVLLPFDLVISLHCKQLFPNELVLQKKCVNVHPGLNPFNRGWYPQVFSIINKLPAGATIHEIDVELDHGPVIAQQQVEVFSWDTSLSIYNRVLDAEVNLLDDYLERILSGNYTTLMPLKEGNLNLKKDFNDLCRITLTDKASYQEVIDKLRALTHGEYSNAYFTDPETGKKIFISIALTKEK